MEVQLTDFENAAFTVFIVLLSRVILYFDLNLYQPLSKVDENMSRAQKRDALLKEKFWFAQSLMPRGSSECPAQAGSPHAHAPAAAAKPEFKKPDAPKPPGIRRRMSKENVAHIFSGNDMSMQEVSILEILQGTGTYKGLIPMILAYLDMIGTDSVTLRTVSTYLDFIVARAAGELMTPAAWMRSYIRAHPDYKHDSVISSRVAADLMLKCHRIGQGLERVPELHGTFHIEPVHAKDGYHTRLPSEMPLERSVSGMGRVVERYAQRSELMARKRKLQSELETHRATVNKIERSLDSVESQLAVFNAPSPSIGGPSDALHGLGDGLN